MWPLGRKSDEIVVDGVSVLPLDVWGAIESVDACAMGLFQVIRAERQVDRLRLRVGYSLEPAPRLDSVRDELMAAVLGATGVEPEVELVPNEALLRLGPPHKIPRVARA
jgi:phenylacetate-CoA ligase